MRALDRDLNRVILELSPAHVARDFAPSTFAELMQSPGIVWSGASDATIYEDPRVNHAFRAWHDAAHVAGLHDFTMAGEAATAERQIRELLAAYPRAPRHWREIIRAEVTGQAEYFARHGAFPVDQAAFVLERLDHAHV